ncbi:MAG: pilus assembly protein N-terminal domain-containing protein [Geminicoccaceae bacterium]
MPRPNHDIFLRTCRHSLAVMSVLALLTASAAEVRAIEPAAGPVMVDDQLESFDLELRSGRIFQLETPAAAVFVADPAIADIQAHSPSLFYVFGKKTGKTTIYAVDNAESVIFQKDIIVTHSVGRLNSILGQALPGSDVRVTSLDSGIVLTGSVAKPVEARDAEELAQRFLGDGEIVLNRIEIRSANQVNVRVRIAEISRDADKALGIHWDAAARGRRHDLQPADRPEFPYQQPQHLHPQFRPGRRGRHVPWRICE